MLNTKFANHKILLASQSPRRQELLKLIDLHFTVYTKPDIPEDFPQKMPYGEVAPYLAKQKAQAYTTDLSDNQIIITADTIVAIDNQILNKPANEAEATEMLELLSGKNHEVITGVCITSKTKQKCFSESTTVEFKNLTSNEINYYINNYKPFDKAGAYGIQEWIGAIGIKKIEGSYFNVMGLPIQLLYRQLLQF